MKRKKQVGMTLIEILVVLCLIGLLASLALPNLLRSRAAASESSAGASMRTLATALSNYNLQFDGTWPPNISALGGNCSLTIPSPAASCVLDDGFVAQLASGTLGSYQWNYSASGSHFTLTANPTASSSATMHFYLDEHLVIHQQNGAAATSASPALGN